MKYFREAFCAPSLRCLGQLLPLLSPPSYGAGEGICINNKYAVSGRYSMLAWLDHVEKEQYLSVA